MVHIYWESPWKAFCIWEAASGSIRQKGFLSSGLLEHRLSESLIECYCFSRHLLLWASLSTYCLVSSALLGIFYKPATIPSSSVVPGWKNDFYLYVFIRVWLWKDTQESRSMSKSHGHWANESKPAHLSRKCLSPHLVGQEPNCQCCTRGTKNNMSIKFWGKKKILTLTRSG